MPQLAGHGQVKVDDVVGLVGLELVKPVRVAQDPRLVRDPCSRSAVQRRVRQQGDAPVLRAAHLDLGAEATRSAAGQVHDRGMVTGPCCPLVMVVVSGKGAMKSR